MSHDFAFNFVTKLEKISRMRWCRYSLSHEVPASTRALRGFSHRLPERDAFIARKRHYDPQLRFRN
jgi:hypothetical protein